MFRFRNRSGSRRVPAPAAVGTRVGTDDGFRAVVDTRSVVQPLGSGHRVEWWVGGGDRWYDPSTEAAVRQVRPGAAPVLETRLRVSGGDVVATTWAAVGRGSTGPAVVVELANETPVPVAVAVAVQAASGGQVRRMSADGRRLLVDGTTAVVVDREPGRYALVDAAQDLWAVVSGGGAQVELPRSVRCRIGAAAGALVVPLPHRASLRFAVPAADLVENPSASFPDADRVAAGWTARLVDAATVDIPDGVLSAGAHRALVDLQLAEPTAVGAVELARWGNTGRHIGSGGRTVGGGCPSLAPPPGSGLVRGSIGPTSGGPGPGTGRPSRGSGRPWSAGRLAGRPGRGSVGCRCQGGGSRSGLGQPATDRSAHDNAATLIGLPGLGINRRSRPSHRDARRLAGWGNRSARPGHSPRPPGLRRALARRPASPAVGTGPLGRPAGGPPGPRTGHRLLDR